MIKGGLKTKIYVVELDGFDTHSNQIGKHEELLKQLAAAVDTFTKTWKVQNMRRMFFQ